MSEKRVFQRERITGQRWAKALNVELYDEQYAAVMMIMSADQPPREIQPSF